MYNMSNLKKLKTLDANWAFDKAAMADRAIPIKYNVLTASTFTLAKRGRPAPPNRRSPK